VSGQTVLHPRGERNALQVVLRGRNEPPTEIFQHMLLGHVADTVDLARAVGARDAEDALHDRADEPRRVRERAMPIVGNRALGTVHQLVDVEVVVGLAAVLAGR